MLTKGLIVLLSALAVVSAYAAPEQLSSSERAVMIFHDRMDREAYDEVWQLTSDQFRQENLRSETLNFFRAVRADLGMARDSVQLGTQYQANAGELPTITLSYQTDFEHGSAEETFVFTVDDGKTELWGYHIASNDLALTT